MITRRSALALFAAGLAGGALTRLTALPNRPVTSGRLLLRARSRAEMPASDGMVQPFERNLDWKTSETALIVCDMWDDLYCVSAVRRMEVMIPRFNQVLKAARGNGVAIIHSPSNTMDFYKNAPQRQRMIDAPHVTPPVPIARWCYLDREMEAALPIDDQNEACDDEVLRPRVRMYSRQHPDIEIGPYDGISDNGQEIYNYCEQLGIRNIVMTGVHTNMCVLGRPFGIRQMKRLGRNVVLVRDLTDAMYDPRDAPYVSHERGTEMVIEHIEQYWCPTVLSEDLLRKADRSKPNAVSSGV
ncbi:MAG: isochorismatase family protein [Bryobacterales bacterium]|nr:isochorismatase family protein [Bryobacterales bacterium]